MRDELLNESLFFSLDHAREKLAAWAADYNTRRPHSSIGYQTPAAYAAHLTATGRSAAQCGSSTARPVAPTAHMGVINPGLSSQLDEKRGSRHIECIGVGEGSRRFWRQAERTVAKRNRAEIRAKLPLSARLAR
jgi:Integrase core domain